VVRLDHFKSQFPHVRILGSSLKKTPLADPTFLTTGAYPRHAPLFPLPVEFPTHLLPSCWTLRPRAWLLRGAVRGAVGRRRRGLAALAVG
jgi:hypothetical protein